MPFILTLYIEIFKNSGFLKKVALMQSFALKSCVSLEFSTLVSSQMMRLQTECQDICRICHTIFFSLCVWKK